jgi:nucleoid-associated protein YgaU
VKRLAAALGLIGALAALSSAAKAQPIYPGVPAPPISLDPGAPAAPPPTPVSAPAPQPAVVVVGPDGKVAPAQNPTEPTSYYVGDGPPAPVAEPGVILGGPVPELHVVRRGDTLWDICFLYFNDPWQWPKIWSYNPQITNPHWIYPGDLVRLLPRGVFAQLPTEPESATPAPAPPAPSSGSTSEPTPAPAPAPASAPADTLPAPQRRIEVGIKQTAFVEKSDLDKSITIDGGVDEKVLFGNGDSVYLSYPPSKPPRVGDRYSIYIPGNVVKTGGTEVGAYVHVLGTLEVVSVKQDKHARGLILEANQEIERGAKVGPLLKTFRTVPPSPPRVDAQGTVVAMLTYDQLVGQGEVVFVDLGKQSGVEVGNRMYVVRRGDAYPANMNRQIGQDDRRFPARALGEIVIVDVGDKISVGLVTLAVQEMSVGDIVTMQASK